jgi:RNA polymerase sigma-70 factor, ECF subfamily
MVNTNEVKNLRAAQAGDQEAFAGLVEPYRRELFVYCYRMLGSLQDAEDVVQETWLHAWRRLETFQYHVSFRAWLYKIATHVCLDTLEKRPRRTLPAAIYPVADPREPIAAPIAEPIWLEPLPDEWLADEAANPEARYLMQERITLAFLVALHLLPPRQRAVLILREVLDWRASEVAHLLGLSIPAVNSALHRARTTMAKHYRADGREALSLVPEDESMRRLLNACVHAWETGNLAGLIALLTDDAILTMPPTPSWYQGREAIHTFLTTSMFAGVDHRKGYRLIPTHANGQPALAIYRRISADGAYRAYSLQVLTIDRASGHIAEVTSFLSPELFARFGLPSEWSWGAAEADQGAHPKVNKFDTQMHG